MLLLLLLHGLSRYLRCVPPAAVNIGGKACFVQKDGYANAYTRIRALEAPLF